MWLELVAAIPLICCILYWCKKNPKPLLGIYAQPGKFHFFKKLLFWILLTLRQRKFKKIRLNTWRNDRLIKYGWGYARQSRNGKKEKTGGGYGRSSHKLVVDMEDVQQLDENPHSLDAVYFNGMHRDGTVMVLRIGRRHGRQAELWLTMKLPDVGVLQSAIHPDTMMYNTDGSSFSAGGLKFEMLEPHRRWKIKFNGLLRKGLCNEYGTSTPELIHVKFSFIWEACTDFFSFDTDVCPKLLADAIARETWTETFWQNLKSKHQTHYEQWGEMKGEVHIEGQEVKRLALKSCRDHSFGVRNWFSFHRYLVHLAHLEDGTTFHVSGVSLPDTTSFLKCGYLSTPNGILHAVDWTDLDMPMLGENRNPPDSYSFSFTAGGKRYDVQLSTHDTARYYLGAGWTTVIFEKMCIYSVNGIKGYGIAEFCYRNPGGCPVPVQQSVPALTEVENLTADDEGQLALGFSKPACTSSRLVGGKGCQLALLTQMKSKEFTVPQGFCLTIASFKTQMKERNVLQKKVEELEEIACQRKSGSLQTACEETVASFLETDVCSQVQQAIAAQLLLLFGGDHDNHSFAVRSSAAGEDSADMSAAGQMETYLGVRGLKQIFEAVGKCWASHFTYQAVEYRRQRGQPIDSSMGVVIQEMVPSDASGVLFTRDPLTGNPAYMSLNANYGLGESVVSGSSEPDTITIHRAWDDSLTITDKVIGGKKLQVKIKAGGGTEETDVDATSASKCCLPDSVCLKLAQIGIELEKGFSDPRDIEWAVHKGKLYLLQARPITTLDVESEWELMHEFDSPLGYDGEWLTTGNIGEMMPAAMTPLSITTFYRTIEYGFQDILVRIGLYPQYMLFWKFMQICCNQAFIDLHFLHWITEFHVAGTKRKMAELALLGETLDELSDEELLRYQGWSPWWKKIIHGFNMVKNHMLTSYGRSKHWEDLLKNGYSIREHDKAIDLYNEITQKLPDYADGWIDPFANSSRSGLWSLTLMSVLSQGKPEWKTEHYSDVAMLLGTCEDVTTADVPSAIQEVAGTIYKSPKAKEFAAMNPEAAVDWLRSPESGDSGHKFTEFLTKFGHRCVREGEMYEKSWQSQPTKIVTVLQAMVKGPDPSATPKKPQLSVDEAISKIKSPTTWFGRLVLRLTLPKARAAVGSREWGKDISVQMSEVFKQAWWRLAKMMVHEGRLPEEELLFFHTHYELGQLLRTPSGQLIARAQRRKKLYQKQMLLQFPRFNIGHPKPIEDTEDDEFVITSVSLKGMPVSHGTAKGTARVVTSLQNAGSIQPGDILVVRYTDVGWTPYFPLISGLVTEIGGLLSHGAVVAREYGIPCVVNVSKATSLIHSGDQVVLNATKGTLEKIEE